VNRLQKRVRIKARPSGGYSLSFYKILSSFPDLQFLGHQHRNGVEVVLVDYGFFGCFVLVLGFRSDTTNFGFSVLVGETSRIFCALEAHYRHDRRHPSILIHKLWKPTLFPVEGHWIMPQLLRHLCWPILDIAVIDAEAVGLTRILELLLILVFVEVAIICQQCVLLLELLWRLWTDAVCLFRKCFYAHVAAKGPPAVHEL